MGRLGRQDSTLLGGLADMDRPVLINIGKYMLKGGVTVSTGGR